MNNDRYLTRFILLWLLRQTTPINDGNRTDMTEKKRKKAEEAANWHWSHSRTKTDMKYESNCEQGLLRYAA